MLGLTKKIFGRRTKYLAGDAESFFNHQKICSADATRASWTKKLSQRGNYLSRQARFLSGGQT